MRFRKLRIAWSVECGLLAALLCVLWVRSYWFKDAFSTNDPGDCVILFTGYRDIHFRKIGESKIRACLEDGWKYREYASATEPDYKRSAGFQWIEYRGWLDVVVPYWFPTLLSAALSTAPWVPRRFSLRTLLIGTTVIAVVLGMFVWLSRPN